MSDVRDHFHQLHIKPRPDSEPALLAQHADIYLDDLLLKGVMGFTLEIANDALNTVKISLAVRDVEIDDDFLVALEAHITARREEAA